jgi:Protein of unknown function (DUF2958)
MAWLNKEIPLPFDREPIEGFGYFHGDLMAKRYQQEWMQGKKYPLLTFPTLKRELVNQEDQPFLRLFGQILLPYQSTRDEALQRLAEPLSFPEPIAVIKEGDTDLNVRKLMSGQGYRLTFDNARRQIANIVHTPDYAMELLDGEQSAALPQLRATEDLSDDAIAVVKFFTPDANWTWWATEFDGNDLFFGLVSGFEVEYGYFSLSELEQIRGVLGLPVERDLYYRPQSLGHIHEQLRNV